jgi:predicted NBD/HSP70 family sugar kinase
MAVPQLDSRANEKAPLGMSTVVIDIGGTNVKVWRSATEKVKFAAGKTLTPDAFVTRVSAVTTGWDFERISIGYPGEVKGDRPTADPYNLGAGWADFDFARAFDKPLRMMNDACLQALGSYDGGKMLYLGLGTSIGTTLIYEDRIVPLALGHLPLGRQTFEHYLSRQGLKRYGRRGWNRWTARAVNLLKPAFLADYVVLGGGNAKKLSDLPDGARQGGNHNVWWGGLKLWEATRPDSDPPVGQEESDSSSD